MRALACLLVALLSGCSVPVTTSCEPVGGIEPFCGLQAPEDLAEIPSTPWLIASQMASSADPAAQPGALVALHLQTHRIVQLYPRREADEPRPGWGEPACPGPPGPGFAPHGIDLEGARLLVVDHGGREAIEVFELDVTAEIPRVIWRGCALAPDDASLNDVAALPGGGFATTQMLERGRGGGLGSMIAMLVLGTLREQNTGRVLAWEPGAGWSAIPASEGAGPNGIEATPDGQTLFFAEFTARRVTRIARDGSGRTAIPLDFMPDNLTWTARSSLLAAGPTTHILTLLRCARVAAGSCQLPFAVAEIDPARAVAREILRSEGEAGGGVSVALELDGELYLGAFTGDRILHARREN